MANEVVGVMARQIRTTFVFEVRREHQERHGMPSSYSPPVRWDGGVDAAGVRHKSVWPRIARFVLQHHLDPDAYVRAQFERSRALPHPGILLTLQALERYQSQLKREQDELPLAYQSQLQRAQIDVGIRMHVGKSSELDSWITVLWNPRTELSALFRYCIAAKLTITHRKSKDLHDLLRAYRPAAVIQYQRHPLLYRKIWKGMLPKSFPSQVRREAEPVDKGVDHD